MSIEFEKNKFILTVVCTVIAVQSYRIVAISVLYNKNIKCI